MFMAFQVLGLIAIALVVVILATAAVRLIVLTWMAIDADVQTMRRRGFWGDGRIKRPAARRARAQKEDEPR